MKWQNARFFQTETPQLIHTLSYNWNLFKIKIDCLRNFTQFSRFFTSFSAYPRFTTFQSHVGRSLIWETFSSTAASSQHALFNNRTKTTTELLLYLPTNKINECTKLHSSVSLCFFFLLWGTLINFFFLTYLIKTWLQKQNLWCKKLESHCFYYSKTY